MKKSQVLKSEITQHEHLSCRLKMTNSKKVLPWYVSWGNHKEFVEFVELVVVVFVVVVFVASRLPGI